MKIKFVKKGNDDIDIIDTLNSGSAVTFAMTYANIHDYKKAICEDAGWTLTQKSHGRFQIEKNNIK